MGNDMKNMSLMTMYLTYFDMINMELIGIYIYIKNMVIFQDRTVSHSVMFPSRA